MPCALGNVGFYTTGLQTKYTLEGLIPKRLGTWYVKAGVQYYHIVNDALLAAQQFNFATTNFPGAKDDIVLVNGGFGFSLLISPRGDRRQCPGFWPRPCFAGLRERHGKPRGEGDMTMTTAVRRPALWTPSDWNAFFGFGTNILVNMLVLTGLLRFVLKMPDSIVFGRILPALGLMMCLSTFYYAWLAYRLALKTGRTDVCALPSGVSVPHMFVVTFVIMLPIASRPAIRSRAGRPVWSGCSSRASS